MHMSPLNRPFNTDQAAPLLHVISKLHRVVIVDDGPYLRIDFPHICWIDAEPFRQLNNALLRYPGPFRWAVFLNLPRRCLLVEPNVSRGESPFFKSESSAETSELEITEFADRLEALGVPVPWRNSPFVDPAEYRAQVVAEIPRVAAFIDKALQLEEKPSLGVEVSHESLELPLIEDHDGPGRGVVLVTDVRKYAREKTATSQYDRAVHYWITEEEELALTKEIMTRGEDYKTKWPLLWQVGGARYGGLAIPREDVARLALESERLGSETDKTEIRHVLRRIQSVCRSAENYHLGIFIPGE